MKNMDLGILKRFFLNILHIEKNAIAGGVFVLPYWRRERRLLPEGEIPSIFIH